jgi:hypothetical protein
VGQMGQIAGVALNLQSFLRAFVIFKTAFHF